ncbi:MAG: mismatch-specific DNA-glycosylase [Phycisphaerae bacterium]|nr:mismatch-specific DNA-glycosylase [Gemmatimonadaceae bacterium]
MLSDILDQGLNVVFCGTAAGNRSAEVGTYYAGRGNKFWPTLHKTRLTPELVPFDRQRDVLQYNIGLTDLVKGQSGMDHAIDFSGELSVQLLGMIRTYRPKIVCFNGKRAASLVLNQPKPVFGEQRERVEGSTIFVAPSTSGAANSHWNEEYWHQLATLSRIVARDA